MRENKFRKLQLAFGTLLMVLTAMAPAARAADVSAGTDRIGIGDHLSTRLCDWRMETPSVKTTTTAAQPKTGFTTLAALPIAALVEMIKVGKDVWDVIRDNKAVYDIQTDCVSVLPKGTHEPMELANWQEASSPSLKVEIDDLFGGNMLTFVYHLNFNYGGKNSGRGVYLANVTMVSDTLDLHAIGLSFQARVQTLAPLNAGTNGAPVAQLKILVPLKAEGLLSSAIKTDEFTLSGNGKVSVVQRSNAEWK